MPRSDEIAHYSALITDLEISVMHALIRGETVRVADLRAALIEARDDIWTLLSHDALKGHPDLDQGLLDRVVELGRSEEATV
jgi:hypothetical protein